MDNSETLAPFGDKRHRTKTNKTKHKTKRSNKGPPNTGGEPARNITSSGKECGILHTQDTHLRLDLYPIPSGHPFWGEG
jgi:hypothetical protein